VRRIAGVAAVLAISRAAALAGHQLAWSPWSPIAYLWQDGIVVLVYAAIELALRRTPRLAWTGYALFVSYVALGVPVWRVMSTPMTWTMWRAAGGALSDSIWVYATLPNLLWMTSSALAAIIPVFVAQGFSPAYGASGFSRTSQKQPRSRRAACSETCRTRRSA
jgi:hypothetical protein